MAESERALDKVVVTFNVDILKLIKLESVYRRPGMTRSECMDAALDDLLKGVKTTKAMQNRRDEIYAKNAEHRLAMRKAWAEKMRNGGAKRAKRADVGKRK